MKNHIHTTSQKFLLAALMLSSLSLYGADSKIDEASIESTRAIFQAINFGDGGATYEPNQLKTHSLNIKKGALQLTDTVETVEIRVNIALGELKQLRAELDALKSPKKPKEKVSSEAILAMAAVHTFGSKIAAFAVAEFVIPRFNHHGFWFGRDKHYAAMNKGIAAFDTEKIAALAGKSYDNYEAKLAALNILNDKLKELELNHKNNNADAQESRELSMPTTVGRSKLGTVIAQGSVEIIPLLATWLKARLVSPYLKEIIKDGGYFQAGYVQRGLTEAVIFAASTVSKIYSSDSMWEKTADDITNQLAERRRKLDAGITAFENLAKKAQDTAQAPTASTTTA